MKSMLRALAVCRRVLLLLLLGITLLGAWIYTQMPKLDELRPSIESYLKHELHLESLTLGDLSWYWAGFLWIESDRLSFETANHEVAFKDGSISVRIPVLKLLTAHVEPERIRLHGGKLKLNLAGNGATPAAPIAFPGHLALEEVDFSWQYGDLAGHLPALHLFVDGHRRKLTARTAELQLSLQLGPDRLPETLRLQTSGNSWLPTAWQSQLSGPLSGELQLSRDAAMHWMLHTDIRQNGETLFRPAETFSLPFRTLQAKLAVQLQKSESGALQLAAAELKAFDWQSAQGSITGKGRWQKGVLTLDADSPQLAMPLLWSWLKPLEKGDFHTWLARMQHGTASGTHAHLELPWAAPLSDWPDAAALDDCRYRVHGKVADADVSLGLSDYALQHIAADVELDESGLHAHVVQASLPLQIGQASGDLLIPWNTLELHITGTANINAARLTAWQAPELLDSVVWQQSDSHVNFMLRWQPPADQPAEANIVLQPEEKWQFSLGSQPFTAIGGTVQWNRASGLAIDGMQIRTPNMHGTVRLHARRDSDGRWQLDSARADVRSDFAGLASRFELPVGKPAGSIHTTLQYDNGWSGSMDLTDAGWGNLLGSAKKTGKPYRVDLAGQASGEHPFDPITVTRIATVGDELQLSGSGSISHDGLKLKLDHIKSLFFDGGMQVHAPFGLTTPWEIDVKAALLYRKALPQELAELESSKPWALRANIEHFIWNEASLSGVTIQLASSRDSVGLIEAKQIHTARIDLMNVRSMFSLPGHGHIDLRHLSADLEKQQVSLSGNLEPAKGGGMRWQGFAEVSGDFGHLMRQGGLSERFIGGHMHALFSGKGIVMREQPWWEDMEGRLRLRVDKGRILEGGSLTKLLAAFNLADLPKLLVGQRQDLKGPGLMYDRLQMEGILSGKDIAIRNIVVRATAFDVAGRGKLDLANDTIDLLVIARPLQNLDALLSKIPLLRDLLGGAAHSLMRKVYRMHGKFSDATVENVDPEQAGLAEPGLVEQLLALPERWFGSNSPAPKAAKP